MAFLSYIFTFFHRQQMHNINNKTSDCIKEIKYMHIKGTRHASNPMWSELIIAAVTIIINELHQWTASMNHSDGNLHRGLDTEITLYLVMLSCFSQRCSPQWKELDQTTEANDTIIAFPWIIWNGLLYATHSLHYTVSSPSSHIMKYAGKHFRHSLGTGRCFIIKP